LFHAYLHRLTGLLPLNIESARGACWVSVNRYVRCLAATICTFVIAPASIGREPYPDETPAAVYSHTCEFTPAFPNPALCERMWRPLSCLDRSLVAAQLTELPNRPASHAISLPDSSGMAWPLRACRPV